MLSTVSTQANTILQLEMDKTDLEWEVTLLFHSGYYGPQLQGVSALHLHHHGQHQLGTQFECPSTEENPQVDQHLDEQKTDDLIQVGDVLLDCLADTRNVVRQSPPAAPSEDIVRAKQRL